MEDLIKVEDLHVSYRAPNKTTDVLKGLNFSLAKGETLVVVGESGSGKTTLGKALSGLLTPSTKISGKLKFKNELFDLADPKLNWREIRGVKIGHIFQDSSSSLNPRRNIKKQFIDTLVVSRNYLEKECTKKSEYLLNLLNFREIGKVLNSYPFQLSGGMRQRVSIALSLSLDPSVLIADEITSALDLKSQYELIQLLDNIKNHLSTGIIFITHDLNLAEKVGDRILYLNSGVFDNISGFEKIKYNSKPISNCTEEKESIILQAEKVSKNYGANDVLKELSFSMNKGEIFGILGESGCGKSTLARLISGIESSYTGNISFDGENLDEKLSSEGRLFYKDVQIIFQDERGSLNPYKNTASIVEESIKNLRPDISNPKDLATECLKAVHIEEDLHKRKATHLSTGQCQRVSIARAVAVEPKLLILDEVVSALDVRVKSQILELLKELQKRSNISMLMISHEIDVLQAICQRVAMMDKGKIKQVICINEKSKAIMESFLLEG
ncbi:MAG: ATP-binding cassette domain-containing protein [Treponemataceae bacterium]